MKTQALAFIIFCFSCAQWTAAEEKKVHAIDVASGHPVSYEKVILSRKGETRRLVDAKNMKIELGDGASSYFEADGTFHLLRGSAILETGETRDIRTVNAKASFKGQIVLSYDYREQSSSLFVIFGNAQIENPSNTNSQKKLNRSEGATLITGEYYPSVIRNLDFNTAGAWLERYGWDPERRKELLSAVPNTKVARTLASTDENSPHSAELKKELLSYFSVEQNREGPKKYEKQYTVSALHGKGFSTVEQQLNQGEEIEIITPEQAAVIVLPEIDLGPGIRLSAQKEQAARDPKLPASRKPASLSRVKQFSPLPGSLPNSVKGSAKQGSGASNAEKSDYGSSPIHSALERLDQLEASQAGQVRARPAETDDSDLQQNF